VDDGRGLYDLVGFVSHMGPSTASGHYVCHIRKDPSTGGAPSSGGGGAAQWFIFNDRKVAVSSNPPLELGYVYLYRRRDAGGL
jgi:ubiquitin carboxyl-terminal hydrolase 5/13